MTDDNTKLDKTDEAERGFFSNLASAVENVSSAVASATKVATTSVAQSTEFAAAIQTLVERNGGKLSGDQLRVLLERDESPAMQETAERRDRFIDRHGREAWDRHVEAIDRVEAGPDGVRINSQG